MIEQFFKLIFGIVLLMSLFIPAAQAEIITVGPQERFTHLRQVQWDRLKPGDEIQIKARKEPYLEKIFLKRSGTRKRPIKITGVPDESGNLPVLDGTDASHLDASTDPALAGRAIIILGGSRPEHKADFILIRNFELRNANNKLFYHIGKKRFKYPNNAAGIYLQRGTNVVVDSCKIHSCCMGVQTAYYPEVGDFKLSRNVIFNNGDFTRTRWGHNVYLSARRSVVEFNRFGELYSDGNNIKDRSNLTIIRYNWIEGGMSRQIDLVETRKYPSANAFVYGNVIISGKRTKNPKMILFGGDVGENSSRNGTLYFFNNTIHFKKKELDGFIWVNRKTCRAVLTNNVFLGGEKIWFGSGSVTGFNNLISLGANRTGLSNSFIGGLEQMQVRMKTLYFPRPGSVLIDNGFPSLPARVAYVPMPWPEKKKRVYMGSPDIGAYEFNQFRN